MRLHHGHVVLAAASVLLASCAPTSPDQEPMEGQFAAIALDGKPLPVPLESEGTEQRTLVADTLRFERSGEVHRTIRIQVTPTATGQGGSFRSTQTLEYRRARDRVAIGSFRSCPADALCMPNDTGSVSGHELELRTHWFGWRPDRPLPTEAFRRVGP